MSEANMLVLINEAITENTVFNNGKLFAEAGGQWSSSYRLDDERIVEIRPDQLELVEGLINDNNIVTSQKSKFIRLVWDRLVELNKTR